MFFFFFNDTATTEIYTLSLHDALPISFLSNVGLAVSDWAKQNRVLFVAARSEEHTSELQSRSDLVCRLLLEKKKPASRGSARYSTGRAEAAAVLSWHTWLCAAFSNFYV